MFKLVKAINGSLGEKALSEKRIADSFEHWWAKFDLQFAEIIKKAPHQKPEPKRTQEDMTKEILTTIRMLYAKIPHFKVTELNVCNSGGDSDTLNVLTVSDEFAMLRDFGKEK
jgi:hypothetical protein